MEGGIEQGRTYRILRKSEIVKVEIDYILTNPLQEGLDYRLVVYHYLVEETPIMGKVRFDVALYKKLLELVID